MPLTSRKRIGSPESPPTLPPHLGRTVGGSPYLRTKTRVTHHILTHTHTCAHSHTRVHIHTRVHTMLSCVTDRNVSDRLTSGSRTVSQALPVNVLGVSPPLTWDRSRYQKVHGAEGEVPRLRSHRFCDRQSQGWSRRGQSRLRLVFSLDESRPSSLASRPETSSRLLTLPGGRSRGWKDVHVGLSTLVKNNFRRRKRDLCICP